MYKVGDVIIYKKDVCKISAIKTNSKTLKEYYVMMPIHDLSLTIEIPTDDKFHFIRDVISKEEAEQFILRIPSINTLDISSKNLDNEYKKLLNGSLEDLVTIIKTTYIRNDERKTANMKASEKDSNYLEKAERQLYNELSISLQKTYEETKLYIIEQVEKLN